MRLAPGERYVPPDWLAASSGPMFAITGTLALVFFGLVLDRLLPLAFRRFSSTIETYGGVTHELRGDALVAEFAQASDAVGLAVQIENNESNAYKRSFAIKVPAAGNQSGGGLRVATFFV